MRKGVIQKLLLLLCMTGMASVAKAHVIPYELDRLSRESVFSKYLELGYRHILPLGLDHILFIACVFLLNTRIRSILIQASMFTLAHSITLGLSMYGIISPVPAVIEPLIALSILMLAIENIYSRKPGRWRLIMIFIFGLVHGMGFAGALSGLGMPAYAFTEALVSFNLGVEAGQLTIILMLYLALSRNFAARPWYHKRMVIPASLVIAVVAAYWTIERTFFN